jgi:TDG/mug DNA glycosylase family protein
MTSPALKRSFPPVVDGETRLLLLGSLPGEQSLARQRYYAHPRNQFWRLIGAVIGNDVEQMAYPDRLAALLGAGIGLWDVVASAAREGSLDASIRAHSANDLPTLLAALPRLQAVAFNGGTAAALGRKLLFGRTEAALVDLPSSSPAYTLAFERKRDLWLTLRSFL